MLIVTDGAVDLSPALETQQSVRVVPGDIWIGTDSFNGTREEFWRRVRTGTRFSTTPPTVSALLEAYRSDDLVVGIHVSAALSATIARAHEAAQRAGSQAVVIDSRSLSVGAGLVAEAIDAAAQVSEKSAILDFANALPERLHTFVLVHDPESLRRSGRAGLLPRDHLVRNRPLLLAVRGRAVALEQPKDRSRAVRQLASHVRNCTDGAVAGWALGHGDVVDVDEIVENMSRTLTQRPAFVTSMDPTVGAHVGADAIVIGVLAAEPAIGY